MEFPALTSQRAPTQPVISPSKNEENKAAMEVIRCIDLLLSGKLNLVLHAEGADVLSEEFKAEFLNIVSGMANAELTDGNEKHIEIPSPYGQIKIVQLSVYGIICLQSTIGDIEFTTGNFATIDSLQKYIKSDKPATVLQKYIRTKLASDVLLSHKAATVLQKNIRLYNIIGFDGEPEPMGEVAALKIKGEVVRYKINPGPCPWAALPAECESKGRAGANKTLTHENANYVILTFKEESPCTVDPSVVETVVQHNLYTIVLQTRINRTQMMSINLGPSLLELFQNKSYDFKFSDFMVLASHIDILHSHGIVHRDIKPENLFLHKGQICLSDNDSAGRVGFFEGVFGTIDYLSPPFRIYFEKCNAKLAKKVENASRDSPISAYKKDQYAFWITLMAIYFEGLPDDGQFYDYEIDLFVLALPCNVNLQVELNLFLSDPVRNYLPDLAGYLTPESGLNGKSI